MAWGYGMKTQPKNQWAQENRWNQVVTNIDEDEYILVKGVDFKKQNLFFLDWWKFGE